ncbi:DUF397 domain-containing protein [Nocardiopsis sp. CNT312]|uniref:DUF397 domain-containing protein n=1 Tax=Nocardiopsis sp. CNT312 TaxID=1137268 RepID=UPI0004918FE5|nr:DUF397 domain-containing protein [Nocardiopsis sp. CNT312]
MTESQDSTSFQLTWHRSSYSADTGGNCVEVADLPCGAAVRDSKHPEAGHLPFPAAEWASFLFSTLLR